MLDYSLLNNFHFSSEDGIKLMRSVLEANGLGLIPDSTDNKNILHDVDQFVKRVASWFNRLDSKLGMYHQYAGSIAEGTKVGLLDEFDIQLITKCLEGKLTVYHQDPCTRMSSMRVKDDTQLMSDWREFLADDNTLMPEKVYSHLLKLLCQILSKDELYEGLNFYYKDFNLVKRELYLIWAPNGQVIKFDMAFMVMLPDWIPPNSRRDSPLLHGHRVQDGCHAMLLPRALHHSPGSSSSLGICHWS